MIPLPFGRIVIVPLSPATPSSFPSSKVPAELLKQGLLYPLQSYILAIEIQTAARVADLVFKSGLARVPRPDDMVAFIRKHVYSPNYSELEAYVGASA